MNVGARASLGLLVALACLSACSDSDSPPPLRFAVFSAFPAELAPLVSQAEIDETVVIGDRVIRVGTLHGVPVVLTLTGIGLVNATNTTRLVLDRYTVDGVIVSGVAGSTRLIGDVTVPETWVATDGTTYKPNPPWLSIARSLESTVALERCTVVASEGPDPVCVLGQPVIAVGGTGMSSDPFNGQALVCQPNGGDVFGCDVPPSAVPTESSFFAPHVRASEVAADGETPIAEDMETANIAREALAHGVPFIAFRAVSDGAGDPLNLPGFPRQFFAYYPLAAENAAAATTAFLDRIAAE